jgi:phage shock protein PspC (stress-responsive transcriptional regulator)
MTKIDKRLLRNTKNKLLAGVAAGIADYFDLDPNVIRFLFIVLTAFGGSGILMYLLLWLLLPSDMSEANDSRDTVKENVQQMKDVVKDFTDQIKKEQPQTMNEKKGKSQQYLGSILVILGILFLLKNLGLIDLYLIQKFWPVLIIFLGVALVSQNEN